MPKVLGFLPSFGLSSNISKISAYKMSEEQLVTKSLFDAGKTSLSEDDGMIGVGRDNQRRTRLANPSQAVHKE